MTSKKSNLKIADNEATLPVADTVPSPEESLSLDANENFFNRELSQLQFNHRVLKQALDDTHPLINRLIFCCIFSSNMDEFFEIRVAGIRQQLKYGREQVYADGLQPEQLLAEISRVAHEYIY
jgi:polyphosphate kinase